MVDSGSGSDIGSEIRTVLNRFEQRARERHVRLKIALQPGVVARAEAGAFRQALSDLIEHAVQRSSGGEVLVTAGYHGGWVKVAVSDDSVLTDPAAAEGALRATGQLVALHGGMLELDARAGEGLIAAMRFPEASPDGPDAGQLSSPEARVARSIA